MMRRFVYLMLVVLALSFFSAACGTREVESARSASSEGAEAIDFTLKDLKGDDVSLSDFAGESAVLLEFTTTWCPHCVTIIPTLKATASAYKAKGLSVVAVYIRENRSSLEDFVDKHGITYTVLQDSDGTIASKYGIRGVPTTIILDKAGVIRYRGHSIPKDIIEEVTE
jgi:peroxiredoxin